MALGKGKMRASKRVFEAEWLVQRLRPFSEHCVASIVPDGFSAYVRILHPAHGTNGEDIRWSEAAKRSGRIMHRLAQFHAIAPAGVSPPHSGNLPGHLLRALCEVLGRYSNTADRCWFCLWNGYGWLRKSAGEASLVFTSSEQAEEDASFHGAARSWGPEVLEGPLVGLPNRSYLLFEGPLDAAFDFGWHLAEECFMPQSPNLFWPEDHSWCAGSEIDLFCTLVGGSEEMADSVLADGRLEAWRVFPRDPVTWDSDRINS